MSLAMVFSRALDGLEAPEVHVEVQSANGLPSFTLVGLADTEVKESRDAQENKCCRDAHRESVRRKTVELPVGVTSRAKQRNTRKTLPVGRCSLTGQSSRTAKQ